MSKKIFSLAVAMLMSVAVSAQAEDGIAASTLADMGLGGLSVMSDSQALAVRGKGYCGGNYSGCKTCGPRGKKSPWSSAFGNSFATYQDKNGNGSHSENGYTAEGPYAASGENFSEAGGIVTNTETVVVDGITKTVTTTCSTKVFAGGYSSAMSF